MINQPPKNNPDKFVIILASVAIIGLGVVLQLSVQNNKTILFLIGIGLGISLLHAAYGFTGSWRQFIVNRNSQGVRSNLALLMITSIVFFPIVGAAFGNLTVSAALGPVSVSVFFGAFLFGIGMQLGGGCGSGTLFTFGQGQTDMLVTLVFFIIGSTLGSAHLHWWLSLPNAGKHSLIIANGWLPALLMQLAVLGLLYWLVKTMDRKRNLHIKPLFENTNNKTIVKHLVYGPWPLWWGVVAIAALSTLTLIVAGHTWSITFAFGLWGAKIWAAIGGDVATWPYWSSGYPARALQQSVLKDTTSVMNFGIVLGAILAAAFAGKFAPAGNLKLYRVIAAVTGGLFLGYGARLAFGCNIGAMLSGISTGSLHGWLWLIAAYLGNIAGVQMRQYLDQLDKQVALAHEK